MKTVTPHAAFQKTILVRFRDCDPAGIVFYPRYLEMFNNLIEDWFSGGLGLPFSELITNRGRGIPTVHLEVDFAAPARMGDLLTGFLWVRRVGQSSIHLEIVLIGPDDVERVRGKLILVLTDLRAHRSMEIPEDLRARLLPYTCE